MKLAKIIAVLTTCLLLAVAAGTATAQSTPTQDAYSGVAGQQESGSGGSTNNVTVAPASSSSSGGGSLPFTGTDLVLIGLAGTVLVGTGLVMRRTIRHHSA